MRARGPSIRFSTEPTFSVPVRAVICPFVVVVVSPPLLLVLAEAHVHMAFHKSKR